MIQTNVNLKSRLGEIGVRGQFKVMTTYGSRKRDEKRESKGKKWKWNNRPPHKGKTD